jgi:predicted transcriptional regulator YdeE
MEVTDMKHRIRHHDERYFIGIEFAGGVTPDQMDGIPRLWEDFMKDITLLADAPLVRKYIGLECYPPDFIETKTMDYYALVQTKTLIHRDGFVSKRLPAGDYIEFLVEFDDLPRQFETVYRYLRDHEIRCHSTFDYEDYQSDQDYNAPGATLYLAFLLDHEQD